MYTIHMLVAPLAYILVDFKEKVTVYESSEISTLESSVDQRCRQAMHN